MAELAPSVAGGHLKDEVLDALANEHNIAQFASFSPGPHPKLRFARVRDYSPAPRAPLEDVVSALLSRSPSQSINVRSFDPHQPRSNDFIYGLTTTASAVAEVQRLATRGLHTILNETIDVRDGGVSGVMYGGTVEFAPEDTPRAVEKPGVASLPRAIGLRVLEAVYGFEPSLDFADSTRVEFSIHPLRQGLRARHTIVWELEQAEAVRLPPSFSWPNRFSRFIGDKVFGLLIADAVGLNVPYTRVLSRHVAPFEFGASTNTGEYWMRTAPFEQVPGRFVTTQGWTDPFEILARDDPDADTIPSVMAQEGVDPAFSGAAITGPAGMIIEGVAGTGEEFMQGVSGPEPLPSRVKDGVAAVLEAVAARLGAVRFEWVHDGETTWVVQFHRGSTESTGTTVFPGEPTRVHPFDVARGLAELRELVREVRGTGEGIVLLGSVGVTSHFGDLLRSARIPSRIALDVPPTSTRLFSTG